MEPPTEMVDAVKAAVDVRVSPDKVMVAVAPRDQAALPLLTVSVIAPALTALEVTSVPRLLPETGKYIASGVPEKGRPVMSKVEEMVLAAPAELTSIVTVRQAALVWQVLCVALFVRFGATLFRKRVMKSGPAPTRARRFALFRRPAG